MLRWRFTESSEDLDKIVHADVPPDEPDSDETRFSPVPVSSRKEHAAERLLSDSEDEDHHQPKQNEDAVVPERTAQAAHSVGMGSGSGSCRRQFQLPQQPSMTPPATCCRTQCDTVEQMSWSETQPCNPAPLPAKPVPGLTQCNTEEMGWSETQPYNPPPLPAKPVPSLTQCNTEELGWSETLLFGNEKLADQNLPVDQPPDNVCSGDLFQRHTAPSAVSEAFTDVYIHFGDPAGSENQVPSNIPANLHNFLDEQLSELYLYDFLQQHEQGNLMAHGETKTPCQEAPPDPTVTTSPLFESGLFDPWMSSQTDNPIIPYVDDIIASLQDMNFLEPHDAKTVASSELNSKDYNYKPPTAAVEASSEAGIRRGRGRGRGRPRSCSRQRERGRGRSSSKSRKRSRSSRARSAAAATSQPPEEPSEFSPFRKIRKLSESTGRINLPAASCQAPVEPRYRRLQHLRYHMQDILCGRAQIPTANEAEAMRQEVLDILGNLATFKGSRCGRTEITRHEQAMQATEKLLHQLQVLIVEADSYPSFPSETKTQPVSVSEKSRNSECRQDSKSRGRLKRASNTPKRDKRSIELLNEQGFNNHSAGSASKCVIRQKGTLPAEGASLEDSGVGTGTGTGSDSTAFNPTGSCTVAPEPGPAPSPCALSGAPCATGDMSESLLKSPTNTILKRTHVNVLPQSCINDVREPSVYESQRENEQWIQRTTLRNQTCTANSVCSSTKTAAHNPLSVANKTSNVSLDEVFQQRASAALNNALQTDAALTMEFTDSATRVQRNLKDQCSLVSHSKPDNNCFLHRGPLTLTATLLPKPNEMFSTSELPPDFWSNPKADFPEIWIKELDWDI